MSLSDKKFKKWLTMDTASFLYSAMQREEYSMIFRFSAMMEEEVKNDCLQSAIYKMKKRFPQFFFRIRKGVFWYYFEENKSPGPFVKEDVSDPCMPVRFNEDGGWLIRFFSYKKRISIEVFHAVADGLGALTFFKTLLAQYLRECGYAIPNEKGVFDINEEPNPDEWEDAYSRYIGKYSRGLKLKKRVYNNIGTAEPFYTFNVTMGFIRPSQMKEAAAKYGCTVSEYLASVLIYILIQKQKSEGFYRQKPISVSVPINLRAFFQTKTLRNFIQTVQVIVDPGLGEYSFNDITKIVSAQMKLNSSQQMLRAHFTKNVKLQSNLFLKLIPIFIKDIVLKSRYARDGVKSFSVLLTNVGVFKVPQEMQRHIRHMEAIQGQTTIPRPQVAIISYADTMEITFSGTQKENDLEREFFRFLIKDGIAVKIESNRKAAIGKGEEN